MTPPPKKRKISTEERPPPKRRKVNTDKKRRHKKEKVSTSQREGVWKVSLNAASDFITILSFFYNSTYSVVVEISHNSGKTWQIPGFVFSNC